MIEKQNSATAYPDPKQETRLLGNNIVSINEDKTGNIWIGTDDGGLNCYQAATKTFSHYFNEVENDLTCG